jgi:hypothetical protein
MGILSETESDGGALVERGQALYDERLKAALEPAHDGRFVAIDPATGRYFLGDTGTAALVAARAALPGGRFYLTRVGRRAAHTVGGHATRVG